MRTIKFLPIALLFMFCHTNNKIDLSGHWNVHHIIINDKDILENDIDSKNMFNQGYSKIKFLAINIDSLYLSIDRNKKPITAKISLSNESYAVICSR